MQEYDYTIADLLRVMQRLRDPQTGCPWDISQDFHSIVPSTLEECYELAEAIEGSDYPHVAEELGDVLFQGSIGRTDFPRGDFDTLISSIQEKVIPLGQNVTFHCGHGPSSTLGYEAQTNPFLLDPARYRGMM